MSDTSGALRRLVGQVGDGGDALIGGTPVQARQLIAEAALSLSSQATVVSVASPIGELSLSALIAQLSGRLDLDDQDDAILELGFKRLQGEGQTVLMVLAPAGISRSALRYLQHVSRQSPRLAMAMYRAPSLAPVLDEAGFAVLRDRLYALPAIEFDGPAEAAPAPSVVVTPPILASEPVAPVLPAVAPKTRRPLLWAASAVSLAAVAGVVWLAHSAPGTAVAGGRSARADVPLVAATVPLPGPATSSDPVKAASPPVLAAAAAASPPLAYAALVATAHLPQIPLATLPLAPSDKIAAGLGQPSKPERTAQFRRPPRFARAQPYWAEPRYQEPAEYEMAPSWNGISPVWVRRDQRRRDGPYLGTYAVGPNGVRAFQYDP